MQSCIQDLNTVILENWRINYCIQLRDWTAINSITSTPSTSFEDGVQKICSLWFCDFKCPEFAVCNASPCDTRDWSGGIFRMELLDSETARRLLPQQIRLTLPYNDRPDHNVYSYWSGQPRRSRGFRVHDDAWCLRQDPSCLILVQTIIWFCDILLLLFNHWSFVLT